MSLESIFIFTDGSSRGNPGPGGFGAVIIADGKVTELGGREEHTTNNRMELRAAIEGLRGLTSNRERGQTSKELRITIYTDSSYLVNGITKWIHGWQKNGWKTKAKLDVENRDLWERLAKLTRNKNAEQTPKGIEWKLVGGHTGVAGNQRCDEIATMFADNHSPRLYSGVLKNYSIKNILDISEDAEARGEKRETRRRQHAKAYSYVSMVDGKVETHKMWAECEQRVRGKQAKYKKAFSAEEERNLIEKWGTH